MDQTVSVPEYDPTTGLRFEWEADSVIRVLRTGDTTIVRANPAGLVSLARHLLTLAQERVPAGRHIHLDASNGLENDSEELILERA